VVLGCYLSIDPIFAIFDELLYINYKFVRSGSALNTKGINYIKGS
jgi:hypothetical protein